MYSINVGDFAFYLGKPVAVMKIIKDFEDKEFAKDRSHPVLVQTGTQNWRWGLGDDGQLYAQGTITGYIYEHGWWLFRDMCMGGLTLAELKRVYENLIGTVKDKAECVCDIRVLMMKGCQCIKN